MCKNQRFLKVGDLAHKSSFQLGQDGVMVTNTTEGGSEFRWTARSVIIDRPFYFFVHKTDVPTVLFAGRYVEPE